MLSNVRKLVVLISKFIFLSVAVISSNAHGAEVINYNYDSMHRLIKEDFGSVQIVKTYDALGNRLVETVSTSTVVNNPPDIPHNLAPSNGATNVSQTDILLSWSAEDPDSGDSLVFEIYLGEESTPPLYTSGIKDFTRTISSLKPNTTYYWKIIAKDNHNAVTEGPTWSFTTNNTPPSTVGNRFPADGAVVAYENNYLDWDYVAIPNEGEVTFSVYFGTEPSPPLFISNISDTIFSLGELTPGTTYYWLIVATDSYGAESTGPLWSFTTNAQPINRLRNVAYSENTNLTKTGGPYIVSGYLSVQTGATLTIEPGTIIKMERGAYIRVSGELIADGNESEPIVFTSAADDNYGGDTNGDGNATVPLAGDWYSIGYWHGGTGLLNHCKILYGGSSGGVVSVYLATATLSNNLIMHTSSDGILVQHSQSPTLNNNTILNAGGRGIWIDDYPASTTKVYDNTIKNSTDIGILITAGTPDIHGNTVADNRNYALKLTGGISTVQNNTLSGGVYIPSNTIADFTENTLISDNNHPSTIYPDLVEVYQAENTPLTHGKNNVLQIFAGTITQDSHWKDDFKYTILGSILVQGTDGEDNITSLVLDPGVELSFNSSTYLGIGNSSGYPGALIAEGTAEKTILFTSSKSRKAPGDWRGVIFYRTAHDSSRLDHCRIEYGGYSSQWGGLYIYGSSPHISNTTVANSKYYGIRVDHAASPSLHNIRVERSGNYGLFIGSAVVALTNSTIHGSMSAGSADFTTMTGNTIYHNETFPVKVGANFVGSLSSANVLINTGGSSFVSVSGGTISLDATWQNIGLPYVITGNITIQGTNGEDGVTTLTLQPGVELRFNRSTRFIIGASSGNPGALIAEGTETDPILFTSAQEVKVPGNWYGIIFYQTSTSLSTISHCIVEYAGYSS